MTEIATLQRSLVSEGFALLHQVVSDETLSIVEQLIVRGIRTFLPGITDPNERAWIQYAREHPDVVGKLYDLLRDSAELVAIGKQIGNSIGISSLLPEPMIYQKIPLRVDVPFETKEIAFWHQDIQYVQGDKDEYTLWVPVYDCSYFDGCLMVMPGSHQLGVINHSVSVGKKRVPRNIYSRDIRYIEMVRRDVLLFSTRLLHSGSLNLSERIRYSVNFRFTSRNFQYSTEMIGVEEC